MAPIAGRPFLAYLLHWLASAGIENVTLCIGHKKSHVIGWVEHHCPGSLRVTYSEEDKALGTAGAIRRAKPLIRGRRFLVVNGDSFLDVDLHSLVSFHRRHKALATMALARVRTRARYGAVHLDSTGKILAFREKSPKARGALCVNGGVYVLENRVLDLIPPGKPVSLEHEIFPRLVGKRFYSFAVRGYFIDIGVPVDYKKAQRELPRRFSL